MPEHLIASLVVALIGGIVDLDSTAAVQCMISQPIVAAPLTGLILGSLAGDVTAGVTLGLMVGVILQLMWIEQLPLGQNVPPDAALASVLSVALGFCASQDYADYSVSVVCQTVALPISVGLGLLGRGLDMFVRRINTNINDWVKQRIDEDDFGAIKTAHLSGLATTFTKAFIFCFLIIWFGVEPIKYFTQMINSNLHRGFVAVQGLLPAVGFSVLLSMCLKNKSEIKYVIIGILIFAFIPVANPWIGIIASLIVMTRYYVKNQPKKRGKKQ